MNWKTLLCSLLIAVPALADDFKSSNALYDAGKFAEAAAAYAQLSPKTVHVYFNLGNAWFRQDKPGLALLNYERARQLAPRDPDILANLKFAQQRLGVDEINTPPKPAVRFFLNAVRSRTLIEWAWYEVGALWLTLLAVAGCIWRPHWRTGFVVMVIVAVCVWSMVTMALICQATAAPEAIVLATKTEARFAPLADGTVHFEVTEGTKVAIYEDRGSWWLVERADGRQGWVLSDAMDRVNVH